MNSFTDGKLLRGLKIARVKAGLKQKALAKRVEVGQDHLSRIELCKLTPSWGLACRLADALGVGLDDLVEVA